MPYFINNGAENVPKLGKSIYEWVSTNNRNIMVPSACKYVKMAGSQGPESPFFGPQKGLKIQYFINNGPQTLQT